MGVSRLHVWRLWGVSVAYVGGVVSRVSACPACLAGFSPCHYCLEIEVGGGACPGQAARLDHRRS